MRIRYEHTILHDRREEIEEGTNINKKYIFNVRLFQKITMTKHTGIFQKYKTGHNSVGYIEIKYKIASLQIILFEKLSMQGRIPTRNWYDTLFHEKHNPDSAHTTLYHKMILCAQRWQFARIFLKFLSKNFQEGFQERRADTTKKNHGLAKIFAMPNLEDMLRNHVYSYIQH